MPGGSIRPGGTGGVITPSGQEILQNKAYEGGTASSLDRFVISRDTKANLDTLQAASPQEGAIYYATDLKRYYLDDGSSLVEVGASEGAGGINYIDNFDFETTLDGELPSGWVAYADAAGNSPVDGTGGSPNADWTMLGEKTSPAPILGEVSAILTKTANDRRGHGFSYDFEIDKQFSENPELFKVQFLYNIESGTFDYGDFTDPANDPSELSVWIISDTGGTPVVKELDNFVLDGSGRFVGSFMPDAGITDYRICLHLGTTTAVAWTMAVDNVQVGPTSLGQYSRPVVARYEGTGADTITDNSPARVCFNTKIIDTHSAVTKTNFAGNDWVFTAPVSGSYNVSAMLRFKNFDYADGDAMALQLYKNGTLYSELSRWHQDTTAASTGSNNHMLNGSDIIELNAGETCSIWVLQDNAASGSNDLNTVAESAHVAIHQISGPGQVEEGRVVVASAYGNTDTTSVGSSYMFVTLDTIHADTHAGFTNNSSGTASYLTNGIKYTIPESGYYEIKARSGLSGDITTAQNTQLFVRLNGSSNVLIGTFVPESNMASGVHRFSTTGVVKLQAGDVLNYTLASTGGTNALISDAAQSTHYFSIVKITGPSAQIGGVTSRAQDWDGVKTFNDGIQLDDDAGQDTLDYYREGSINSTWKFNNGGGTSTSEAIQYTRIGNLVTVRLPIAAATTGTGSTALESQTNIDSWARPASVSMFSVFVRRSATHYVDMGRLTVNTDGSMILYRDNSVTAWDDHVSNPQGFSNNAYQYVTYRA